MFVVSLDFESGCLCSIIELAEPPPPVGGGGGCWGGGGVGGDGVCGCDIVELLECY